MTDGAAHDDDAPGRPAPAWALALWASSCSGSSPTRTRSAGAFVFDDLRAGPRQPGDPRPGDFLGTPGGLPALPEPLRRLRHLRAQLAARRPRSARLPRREPPRPPGERAPRPRRRSGSPSGPPACATPRSPPRRGAVAFLAAALFVDPPARARRPSPTWCSGSPRWPRFFSLAAVVLYLAWRLSPPGPEAGLRRGALYAGRARRLPARLPHEGDRLHAPRPRSALAELLLFERPGRAAPGSRSSRWRSSPSSSRPPCSCADRAARRGPGAAVAAVAAADAGRRPGRIARLPPHAGRGGGRVPAAPRLAVRPDPRPRRRRPALLRSTSRVLGSALAPRRAGRARRLARRPRAPGREGAPSIRPGSSSPSASAGSSSRSRWSRASIPIADLMYEHRAYLPVRRRLARRRDGDGPRLLLGGSRPRPARARSCSSAWRSALLLGALALQRNAVWANEVTLWSRRRGEGARQVPPPLQPGDGARRPGRLRRRRRRARPRGRALPGRPVGPRPARGRAAPVGPAAGGRGAAPGGPRAPPRRPRGALQPGDAARAHREGRRGALAPAPLPRGRAGLAGPGAPGRRGRPRPLSAQEVSSRKRAACRQGSQTRASRIQSS